MLAQLTRFGRLSSEHREAWTNAIRETTAEERRNLQSSLTSRPKGKPLEVVYDYSLKRGAPDRVVKAVQNLFQGATHRGVDIVPVEISVPGVPFSQPAWKVRYMGWRSFKGIERVVLFDARGKLLTVEPNVAVTQLPKRESPRFAFAGIWAD
jgi:nitroreductase